jgi:hypothetical protein
MDMTAMWTFMAYMAGDNSLSSAWDTAGQQSMMQQGSKSNPSAM